MFFYFSGQHFFTNADGSEILHVFGPEPNDHYKTIKHTLQVLIKDFRSSMYLRPMIAHNFD